MGGRTVEMTIRHLGEATSVVTVLQAESVHITYRLETGVFFKRLHDAKHSSVLAFGEIRIARCMCV